mmetsp:Transcript_65036/g.55201  ORF Transcript_65036/g.55201 Transcript_65036/m.55201 type:complete len:313 (-) Transcript_65036:17-955(-)
MQLEKENGMSSNKLEELERTYIEQLKLVEKEKSKHLEANIVDREKFDNIYADLKAKLENRNEALEIEIKAKIQDNRVLAEELYKMKEKYADSDSKLDFQNKCVNRLEEENQWNSKELERTKLELSNYRIHKDKKCNDVEISNEKLLKENENLIKEAKNLLIKNESVNKEIKNLQENKGKVSKFVNEVVSINEALVNKVNLLQEKERSRLKEKDTTLKNIVSRGSNSSSRSIHISSPGKENYSRQTPTKKKSQNMFDDMDIHKQSERTNTHANKYNNRALNMNVISKEVEKQKKYADNQLKKTSKGNSRKELV